jgi:cis-3-alkyl-4-acyloxetan-2-one decarboxylase
LTHEKSSSRTPKSDSLLATGMSVRLEPFRHLFPFESRFHDHAGLRQHYVDEGLGAPVVMLHGNPTWSFMYRALIADLRTSYRVIAPDHIGCGLSDKPDDTRYAYTLDQRVRDVSALLEGAGVTRDITLVVHDWGGLIGLAWAVRYAERVKRLVIFNTAAFPIPPSTRLPLSIRVCRDTALGAFLVRRFNAFSAVASHVAPQHRLAVEVRRAYTAPYDSWANRIATLRFVQDIPLGPQHPSFEVVRQTAAGLESLRSRPMMICWGERDFVFDRHFLDEWMQRFPSSEVHRFPDAGHYVLEDAADRIVPLVRSFLAAHPVEESV